MEEQKQNQEAIMGNFDSTEESPEEQARIDDLIAHNPAEDVINLGKIENLEKIIEEATPAEVKNNAGAETLVLSKNKLLLIKKTAQNLKDSASRLLELLTIVSDEEIKIKTGQATETKKTEAVAEVESNIIEGLFDGEKMVGQDGKIYDVPVNYASKSRLVEGDLLKLIITDAGTFIFKQINPIERRRVVGVLEESETGEYYVLADDRRWRVLDASVSYFKGEVGDEVVVIVPKNGSAKWGAVENIIKH